MNTLLNVQGLLADGEIVGTGLSLGSVIAVVCSWQRNHSILWAIVAGLLSWVYVIYYALTRESDGVD